MFRSYDIVKPEGRVMARHFVCAVCFEIAREPVVQTSCGHVYCKECLKPCTCCPLCREPLKEGSVEEANPVTTRMMRAIPVRCPYQGAKKARLCHFGRISIVGSCAWEGEYGDLLDKHLGECPRFPIICPQEDRGATIKRAELEHHERNHHAGRAGTSRAAALARAEASLAARVTAHEARVLRDCRELAAGRYEPCSPESVSRASCESATESEAADEPAAEPAAGGAAQADPAPEAAAGAAVAGPTLRRSLRGLPAHYRAYACWRVPSGLTGVVIAAEPGGWDRFMAAVLLGSFEVSPTSGRFRLAQDAAGAVAIYRAEAVRYRCSRAPKLWNL